MSMIIQDVKTILLRVPLQQRTITDSQSSVTHVEFMQVVLRTTDGLTGYGMNWSYTPGLKAAQTAVDENYTPLLIGADALDRRELVRRMFFSNHFIGRVGATRVGIAAVEFALWDLACKAVNLPLWKLLGPARNSVKAYSTDGGWLSWSTEDLVRDATRLVERGFDAVKLKLGLPDPLDDLARIAAVRKAVGPKIKIMTDVNCAWTLATALRIAPRLAEYDITWLEEPMLPEDVRGHATLQRAITTPIAVGETLYTLQSFRDYIADGACCFVQADATKLLGIDEWLQVAALAAAWNLPLVPHTNVQQKLHVQLAAVTPNALMVENCYESLNDMWVEPIHVKNGHYTLPQEPGCGLQIRDAVIREHRIG
ncbi:MAG: mandelate racemase/muconate lactonizing enzyme family protein [Planctomycetes bacterium]|nr:mandelate racemase/muconate lactonizing enzyme family protein [Planctomycetota bacterium]